MDARDYFSGAPGGNAGAESAVYDCLGVTRPFNHRCLAFFVILVINCVRTEYIVMPVHA